MSGGPWSAGDIVSILTAIAYAAFGMWLRTANRRADRVVVLLGTGLSLGPLLLIVADPILQVMGLRLSLVALVVSEARAVLWWGAAAGAIYIVKDLFQPAPR